MGVNEVTLLSHIGIDACGVRADLWDVFKQEEGPVDAEQIQSILARATAVDARFVEWNHNLAKSWHYWVVGIAADFDRPHMPGSSRFYPGPVHAYVNAHVSWMLNCYRQLRIYMNAAAIRCLKWLIPDGDIGFDTTSVFGPQVQVIQQMIDDVCASTPYQLGYVKDPPPNGVSFAEEMPNYVPQGRGAYFSLIPLFSSSLMECISDTQRSWIQGRLRAIAKINGVRMGNLLAQARPGAILGGLPFLGDPKKYVHFQDEELNDLLEDEPVEPNPFGYG